MNGSLQQSSHSAHHGTDHWVELLRTLADPIRLRIIRLLEQQVHSGLSVGELAEVLKLPQSTVSRHLKTLIDANLAAVTRNGTSMHYRLSAEAAVNSTRQLRTLARQHLDHDPIAKTDGQRLSHVLRQRENASEKFFGQTAPKWDQIRQQWFGNTFHLEALLMLLNPAWTIGDIGTGTGAMLPLLAPHVKKIIAVDPNAAMLKTAKIRIKDQNLSNIDLRPGSLSLLPIDFHTLDVALLTLVLHHVEDPAAALKEIHRTLKPGGLLMIVDLQPHAVTMFQEKMGHKWMGFQESQLSEWLTAAGFGHIRWHSLPAQQGRSVENNITVPDLFVLRAEAA